MRVCITKKSLVFWKNFRSIERLCDPGQNVPFVLQICFIGYINSQKKLLFKIMVCRVPDTIQLNDARHGLRTPNEAFFIKIPNFWGWADNLGR